MQCLHLRREWIRHEHGLLNGYDMSAAYNQNAMMQSGMSDLREGPSTLLHPLTNQRDLPKGKGDGGQPQKGNNK